MEHKLLEECIKYFQQNRGLDRALRRLRDKYRSLGKLGGRIVLMGLTEEEKDALSAFLQKNCYQDWISIAASSFPAALARTRFSGVNFVDVLEGFFQEKLISKKDERIDYRKNKEEFFSSCMAEFEESPAFFWLENVLETKGTAYLYLSRKYDREPETLKKELLDVCHALNNLPLWQGKKMRLALFASLITKNPHAFDDNTGGGRLLAHAVSFALGREYPSNAEEKLEYYYHAGIIKDEVSNFTLCSGLLGYQGGKRHPGWDGFIQAGESLQVSLMNLSRLDRMESPHGKIFVFENPTVFTEVLEKTGTKRPSLLCTYGQIKIASYIILDMLVKEQTQIFYSGDFDPEGIQIAERLKNRYGDNLVFWRYGKEDYHSALSRKTISPVRLKKLDKIKDKDLSELAKLIQETRLAGYQEMLTASLVEDINKIIGDK